MTASEVVRNRIRDRTAVICVVGLGYVGLPTAVAYAKVGFEVIGVEPDSERRNMLNARRSYLVDVSDADLAAHLNSGRLRTVASVSDASAADAIEICVPTPLGRSFQPDVSAIVDVASQIHGFLRSGQLVVLVSTTYPGTTKDLVLPLLEDSGMRAGKDFFLAFAPERIDPGNANYDLRTLPRIVGGVTAECGRVAAALIETIVDKVVPVTDATTAEMTKVLENTFRSINIAHANETAIICEKLGISVWEVIRAASTKPFGFMPFYPGPGIGGHCIPIDPSYLAWKMRELNYTTRFIDLANEVNRHMPEYTVERTGRILNECSKSIRGSRILVLGITYKSNVPDTRESPAIDVIRLLIDRGAEVTYSDPHVPSALVKPMGESFSTALSADLLASQDVVIITADHDAFDWDLIRAHAPLVLDTRGTQHGIALASWHTL